MIAMLDRAFVRLRSIAFFYRFTLFTRIMLAAAFVPTGMVKALGRRFTSIPVEHPIGGFFEAMYQAGGYWRFIGVCQVAAGVLVLIPRLAHLGAAVFLGITTNIFVITVSLDFGGTSVVTGLMTAAVLYLCMWDYHRFRPMLTEAPSPPAAIRHRLDPWEAGGFTVFAICLIGVFWRTRSPLPAWLGLAMIAAGLAAGVLTAGRFFWLAWRGQLCSASACSPPAPPLAE